MRSPWKPTGARRSCTSGERGPYRAVLPLFEGAGAADRWAPHLVSPLLKLLIRCLCSCCWPCPLSLPTLPIRYREVCGLRDQLQSLVSSSLSGLAPAAQAAFSINLTAPDLLEAKNTSRVMEQRRFTMTSFLTGVSRDPVLAPLVLTWLFPGGLCVCVCAVHGRVMPG